MKTLILIVTALCVIGSQPALAFGPKPPKPPADAQAWPTRDVGFGKFLSTPFTLPNGVKVDMSVSLPNLMTTEVTRQAQGKLRVIDSLQGVTDPSAAASPRFVLKGGLTAFEANNFTNSITIGFKPGVGDIGSGTITGASGSLSFNIGTLDMNFYIVDTQTQQVVAVGQGSAIEGGVGLSVGIDFATIHIGDDFVMNPQMNPVITKAIDNAIKQMVNDPNTNLQMDWGAQVSSINTSAGNFLFNAGLRDNIQVNDVFNVYDNSSMLLGEVKVSAVDSGTSTVAFKSDPNGKLLGSVRAGDPVKIFYINP